MIDVTTPASQTARELLMQAVRSVAQGNDPTDFLKQAIEYKTAQVIADHPSAPAVKTAAE